MRFSKCSKFLIISVSFFLSSCAGISKSIVKKDELERIPDAEISKIVLKKQYSFKIIPKDDPNGNLAGRKKFNRKITLLSGEYRLLGRANEGYFYGGPPFCLKDSEYKPRWCGLFFYDSDPDTAYIFYHLKSIGTYSDSAVYDVSSGLAMSMHLAMDERDVNNYTLMLNYPIHRSELMLLGVD